MLRVRALKQSQIRVYRWKKRMCSTMANVDTQLSERMCIVHDEIIVKTTIIFHLLSFMK